MAFEVRDNSPCPRSECEWNAKRHPARYSIRGRKRANFGVCGRRFDCGRAKGSWLLERPARSNVTLEAGQIA